MTDFYAHGSYPAAGASGSSAAMRAELDAIAAAFAKLYGYTGNSNKLLKVNSGGTGYTGSIITDNGTTVTVGGALTVSGATTLSGTVSVLDASFSIKDNADNTKIAQFQLSGITTGTTRTFTFPDATTTLVGTDATQTLTNKTLTSPAINGTVTTSGLTLPAFTLGGNVSSSGNPSLNIGTGALTAGTGTFSGQIGGSFSGAGSVAAYFYNTSASGFGPQFRGGAGANYVGLFASYDGADVFTINKASLVTAASVTSLAFNAGNPSLNIGSGALTAGTGTFSGTGQFFTATAATTNSKYQAIGITGKTMYFGVEGADAALGSVANSATVLTPAEGFTVVVGGTGIVSKTTASGLSVTGTIASTSHVTVGSVGSKLFFDTTGVAQTNYITTTDDYNMTIYNGRGGTPNIVLHNTAGIQIKEGTTVIGTFSSSSGLSVTGTGTFSGNMALAGAATSGYNSSADDVVLGTHTGGHGLTIASQSTSAGYIMFADGTTGAQAYAGQITYDHSTDEMRFGTIDGTTRGTFSSTGLSVTGTGDFRPTSGFSCGRFGSTDVAALYIYSDTRYSYIGNSSTYGSGEGIAFDSNLASAGLLEFFTNSVSRMTLDASGNLLVGTTSALIDSNDRIASLGRVTVKQTTGYNYQCAYLWNNATANDNIFVEFGTEGTITTRGSITYNRGGGVVAYNTTSDYRAKDIEGDLINSGEVIDAFKVYTGKMKGATVSRPMMIAHEAQAVAPYCVTGEKDAEDADGNPIYQSMDHQILVPLLLAEIQSLRRRLAALEAA